MVFQARSVDLDMTVKANLAFHGRLFGLWGKMLDERIVEVTELLDIADLLKRPVRTLSGGNQRRVEIARALLNRPKLLLMDEPSVGLDATTRRNLVAHMQVVRQQRGTSILWATHLVEEVAQGRPHRADRQGRGAAERHPRRGDGGGGGRQSDRCLYRADHARRATPVGEDVA